MGLAPLAKLGRYELLEQLGEGGMGAVWLGRLTGPGGFEKLCIIKTVLPSIAKDADFVSRFLHEGRVLTQLQHSNIAQVLDMGDDGGTLYLALEYVPGVDVARLVEALRQKQEQLPIALAVHLAQQAAEGLGFAHRRKALDGTPLDIVHRDVSPQNVMVSYDGEVKVIDFGIARSEARSRHTAQASVMGKLGYMAPEQARGEHVDDRADQYAVGVLLWELLASSTYVRRGTLTEMVVAMSNPTVRPLTNLRPEVPPAVESVLLKALATDPSDRFATTDDFARALQEQLVKLGLPSKQQVGDYVRTRCSDAFAVQQTLLTRVSTMRAAPDAQPLEQTLVRETATTSPARPAVMPAASADDLPALERSRTPLILGAVAVIAVIGIGGVLATRAREPHEPVRDAGAEAHAPVAELSTGDAGAPQVTPESDLKAGGRLAGGARPALIVVNQSSIAWTHCLVTLPGKRRTHLAALRQGETAELPVAHFQVDPGADELKGEATIDCVEGAARVRVH